jgi:hypothetical protein
MLGFIEHKREFMMMNRSLENSYAETSKADIGTILGRERAAASAEEINADVHMHDLRS